MSAAAPSAAMRSEAAPDPTWPSRTRRLVVTLVAAGLGVLLALRGLAPTPVRAPTEPGFSAARAAERAKAILGDGPRPSSSVNNLTAVERMKEWLHGRGLDVEVQEATIRVAGRDMTIRNVLARKAGPRSGPAVMLVAHHDTVPGSPGVGDDSMGVAIVLEAAAALSSADWQGRDVVLLLTDAEEGGMRGAEHFAANHRWMSDVGAVVNVDSRGNAGPALLYQTGPESANVLRALAPNLDAVVANSFFSEIARHIPNATDFEVFRAAGKPGVNFALIEGHEHYHAASDTWANANMDAMQHLGDAVLMTLFSLGLDPSDRTAATGNAVFLDLGGHVLAWWPERTGVVLSVGCLLALAIAGWFGAKQRRRPSLQVPVAAAAALACMPVAAIVTWLALRLPEWAGLFGAGSIQDGASKVEAYRKAFWPASGPVWLAFGLSLGLVAGFLLGRRLLARLDGWAATCGAWMAPAAVVTVLAMLLPGVTAPLLPVVFAATAAMVAIAFATDPASPWTGLTASAAPAFVAGALLTPIMVMSWPGVGLSMPPFSAAMAAIMASVAIAATCPRGEPTAR